jgi:acyl dehydratase
MARSSADEPRASGGRVHELRRLVGSPIASSEPSHLEQVTPDAIRLFARAYGDGNPIYSDPVYAERSVRGELIAPPLFPIAMGQPAEPRVPSATVDVAAVLGVAPPSAPSADRWTLHRPLVVGTRLSRSSTLHAVDVGDDTALPNVVDATERTVYEASGVVYATHDRVRRFRPIDDPEPGPDPRSLAHYTRAELAEIERAYEAEVVRGSEPRRACDVAAGDSLGPIVKGPLTVTDLVTYRGGVGPGPLGAEALRLGYLSRRQRPARWSANTQGAPETLERRHWDVEYARSLGYPSAYDYSHTRLTWLTHLLTNWMGDGGWVWQVEGAMHAANYVGDTHWVTGVVLAVEDAPACGVVDIELTARNQRAEVTYRGSAIVLLPPEPATCVTIAAFTR